MDITPLDLHRATTFAKISAQDLQGLGKRASNMYLEGGCSLNDAVIKLAQEHPGISRHQVSRIVEFANTSTFHHLFEKQAGDKNVDFQIADPAAVLQSLNAGASPSEVSPQAPEYSRPPIKLSSAGALEADITLMRAFGREPVTEKRAAVEVLDDSLRYVKERRPGFEKVAADLSTARSEETPDYQSSDPFGHLHATWQRLTKIAEDLSYATSKNQDLKKEATSALAQHVSQDLLQGGNLGAITHALFTVDNSLLKEAMLEIMPQVLARGLDYVQIKADMIQYEMEKSASTRVINTQNPMIQAYAAFVKTAAHGHELDMSLSRVGSMLDEVTQTLQEAMRAARA